MWGSGRRTVCFSLLLIKLAHGSAARVLWLVTAALLTASVWVSWKEPAVPHSPPCALNKRENGFPSWLCHCHNPKCSICPHGGPLVSAVSDGCIAMEMCDTLVDELSVSRWASSLPAPAFERSDRPFLSICFVQVLVYLRVWLALLLYTMRDSVPCVV